MADRSEFDRLCVPLRPRLLAHATRLAAGNHTRAEDIVQDAYVRAWRSWADWTAGDDPEGDVLAWMFRIVTNVYLNDYTSRQSKKRTLEGAVQEALVAAQAGVEPPTSEDISQAVLDAVGQIYPSWRPVVEMHYFQEMRCEDIATALGVPLGTVLSRLCRARRALKSLLAEYASEEYGFRLDRSGENPNDQPIVVVEADTDGVDGVVARDDARALRGVEATRHELTSRRAPRVALR